MKDTRFENRKLRRLMLDFELAKLHAPGETQEGNDDKQPENILEIEPIDSDITIQKKLQETPKSCPG